MEAKESKKAMSLGKRSIIGLIAGLIIGGILCFVPAGTMRDDFLIGTVFNIVGNGYLNLIKMTIVPFVFASLVMGISSATDVKQVGRIGSKILLIYMCTTVVASMVGIAGGMILKPGVGVNLGTFDLSTEFTQVETSFADVVLNFIPTNIVASFAEGDMIHIVLFAVFVGIAMSLLGRKGGAGAEVQRVLRQRHAQDRQYRHGSDSLRRLRSDGHHRCKPGLRHHRHPGQVLRLRDLPVLPVRLHRLRPALYDLYQAELSEAAQKVQQDRAGAFLHLFVQRHHPLLHPVLPEHGRV